VDALDIIAQILRIYGFIVFGRVLLSWVPMFTQKPLDYSNIFVKFLMDVTEPVLAPVRRFAMIGMLDLSPILVLVVLNVVASVLANAGNN